MSKRSLVLALFMLMNYPDARAAETADVASGRSAAVDSNLGTNMVGTSADELSCLFKKADPEVKDKDAKSTAEGLEKALKKIKFSAGEFTRVSLLHFMSQVLKETGHLQYTEQLEPGGKDKQGRPKKLPENKKGWGLIQVTGKKVIDACCECVDSCAPPIGTQIKASREKTLGNGVQDRTAAALLSLCWWKQGMLNNRRHKVFTNVDSRSASEKVTQIVNTGGLENPVHGGQANLDERSGFFEKLTKADKAGTCRKI